MKVWDVFPYWREQWALDARRRLWATLAPEADYVPVALVGDRTFRGDPLPVPAELGIETVPVVLDAPDTWAREKQQRDAVWLLRERMADGDLVLIVDADELVDPRSLAAIASATEAGPVKLRLAMYCCGLRWRHHTPWRHATACRARDLVEHPSDRLRSNLSFPKVDDAGWHLTYYGTDVDVDAKLSAFSHAEVDTPEMRRSLAELRDTGSQGFVDDPLTGPLADILTGVTA